MIDTPNRTGPMPDFIFIRSPHMERESGFGLAGHVYTNVPRGQETWQLGRTMRETMRRLAAEVARGEDATAQNALWYGGPPPNAPLPPYDSETLRARAVTCHAAEIHIDPRDPEAYVCLPYPPAKQGQEDGGGFN